MCKQNYTEKANCAVYAIKQTVCKLEHKWQLPGRIALKITEGHYCGTTTCSADLSTLNESEKKVLDNINTYSLQYRLFHGLLTTKPRH